MVPLDEANGALKSVNLLGGFSASATLRIHCKYSVIYTHFVNEASYIVLYKYSL